MYVRVCRSCNLTIDCFYNINHAVVNKDLSNITVVCIDVKLKKDDGMSWDVSLMEFTLPVFIACQVELS